MLYNVYALDEDDRKSKKLNEYPLVGTFDDVSIWADFATEHIDGVYGIEYVTAKCFSSEKCKHLFCSHLVPHHPCWACRAGGKLDEWTTTTKSCPFAIIASDCEG